MNTAVSAGVTISDVGDKPLGAQDTLSCFSYKVYDPFVTSFGQFHTSTGDGATTPDAAANAFYDIIIVFDKNTILFDSFVISL